MKVERITVGPLQTCCYLVYQEESRECLVIDPGAEADRIRARAGERRIAAILLTHGHFDHIGAVRELMEEDTRLVIHALDAPLLTDADLNVSRLILGREMTAPEASDKVWEGDTLQLAGLQVQVLHTPGHTPGSVCYLIGDSLFTGDTLFDHGWGRTDFPGGDEHAMFASLRRVMPLAKKYTTYPGH